MNDAVIGLDAVTMVVSGKCPKQIEQRIEKRNKQGRLYLEVDKTKQNETYNVTIVLPSIIRPSNLKGFSLLDSYKGHLKNVILPAIGKYKMSKVTPAILEQFYRSLTKDNAKKDGKGSYKIASIKKFHKIISGIMRTAVRWNVIEENPCDKAELPRERNKSNDVKHFTLEQAMTFLEAMDKPYSVPFKGHKITVPSGKVIELDTYIKERMLPIQFKIFYRLSLFGGLRKRFI